MEVLRQVRLVNGGAEKCNTTVAVVNLTKWNLNVEFYCIVHHVMTNATSGIRLT